MIYDVTLHRPRKKKFGIRFPDQPSPEGPTQKILEPLWMKKSGFQHFAYFKPKIIESLIDPKKKIPLPTVPFFSRHVTGFQSIFFLGLIKPVTILCDVFR